MPSADLDGPVKAIREASPQALHHFIRFDQVNQLVWEPAKQDPDLGLIECGSNGAVRDCLPHQSRQPANSVCFRQNGPYKVLAQ